MSGRYRSLAARAFALAGLAVAPNVATGDVESGDVEYGAYLAQDCSSCHQKNINSTGIPEIAGLPTDYFISALKAYKEGQRDHSTMQMIARSLDDEQVEALAAFYASK